ncbi:MAG TPA: alternative ribosome rescue aminoacyl-tRNA hydrolase ArfB [bacterium]|nr:aminoacyl-tRNA hydrolase [Candidatus Magasanikbacteria bacterium]MCA9389435.1 aminoacyl-tRNA hydrolase [Candidatus Magasanikbacteria bacterium]HPF95153.1 alternative ribosome rescue aminoacyl-tRNA hydrolase ArfB [bacterium]
MENPFAIAPILPKAEVESWQPPVIPRHEFRVEYVRSSGPGGQKVNKTSSAVFLRWPIKLSQALTEEQKDLLMENLKNRINDAGELVLKVQELRSQKQNLERAIEIVQELVEKSLKPQIERKATKPSRGAKERRLDEKSKKGAIKMNRKYQPGRDD